MANGKLVNVKFYLFDLCTLAVTNFLLLKIFLGREGVYVHILTKTN